MIQRCFNEAPAYYEGLPGTEYEIVLPGVGFNEAPAYYEGLRAIDFDDLTAAQSFNEAPAYYEGLQHTKETRSWST